MRLYDYKSSHRFYCCINLNEIINQKISGIKVLIFILIILGF